MKQRKKKRRKKKRKKTTKRGQRWGQTPTKWTRTEKQRFFLGAVVADRGDGQAQKRHA